MRDKTEKCPDMRKCVLVCVCVCPPFCCGCVSSSDDVKALLQSHWELEFWWKLKPSTSLLHIDLLCVHICVPQVVRCDMNDNGGTDPERCFTATTHFQLLYPVQPRPMSLWLSDAALYQQSSSTVMPNTTATSVSHNRKAINTYHSITKSVERL